MNRTPTSPLKSLASLVAVVVILATTSLAQTAPPTQTASDRPDLKHMDQVPVNLVGWLDSKKAKVGDKFTMKTIQPQHVDFATGPGIDLPKNSRFGGTILAVQSFQKDKPEARITLQIDYVILADGKQMPLHAIITGVAMSDLAAANHGADGGGGGGRRGSSSSTPSAPANVLSESNTPALVDDILPKGSSSAATNVTISTSQTRIPDLTLSVSSRGTISGMLSSKKKNIQLDDGTHFMLRVWQ